MVVERKTKYDTDKPEYQEKSGYVEVQHLRVQSEGNLLNYVQILCVRAFKGERSPATVCAFLDGEWRYLSKYLNFVVRFYKLDDVGMSGGLQKKRMETIRRDVMQAVELIEKDKKKPNAKTTANENNDDSSVDDANNGPSTSKRRRVNTKDNGAKPSKGSPGKKDSVVIDDDHDSDKENIPPNDTTSCIDENAEHEILDSVKSIVSNNTNEHYDQVNHDNNSDSDWAENENTYN